MFDTLKKIIHHKKKEPEPIKPILDTEEKPISKETYHMPGQEDIRRIPAPVSRPSYSTPSLLEQRRLERIEVFRRAREQPPGDLPKRLPPSPEPMTFGPSIEPPQGPSPTEPLHMPRTIEDTLDEIMARLDDIERRLERMEGPAY